MLRLYSSAAETDGFGVEETRCGDKGSVNGLEGGAKFELVGEMGDLVEDLPDLAEIVHSEGFSFGRKGTGVEDDEIEGPRTPQDAPNVEIFEPGANLRRFRLRTKSGLQKLSKLVRKYLER